MLNIFISPQILLIIIITSLSFMSIFAYMGYKTEGSILYNQYLKKMIITSLITITAIFLIYNQAYRQGLTDIHHGPVDIAIASYLAPKPNQTSSTEEINNLTNKEKEDTIIIVYRFGCTNCQKLWEYAQTNEELLPSEKVKWVPMTDENKNSSEILRKVNRYPSIIYWTKNGDNLIDQKLVNPSDAELQNLIEYIYEK